MYNYENLKIEVKQPQIQKSQKLYEITYKGIQLQQLPNLYTDLRDLSKQSLNELGYRVGEFPKKNELT